MKHIIFLCCLFLSYTSFSQYDYFRWTKSISNLPTAVISSKSGLAVDGFNRCYYIDNVVKKVCSVSGEVIYGSPTARSTSNVIYKNNPTYGDGIFYIGSNNKIYALQYVNATNTLAVANEYAASPDLVAPLSYIAVDSKDQLFYIRSTDNKVCTYYRNSSGSGFGVIGTNPIPAVATSNIVYKNGMIYYIGNVSGTPKLCCITYNSSTNTWAQTAVNSDVIKAGSKIQINPGTNQVFYVRASDSRIGCYWNNGTANGYGVCDDSSMPALSGTDIYVTSSGDQVTYIGTDGNFHILYWDNCRWVDNILNKTCNALIGYNAYALANDGQINYFDGSKIMVLNKNQASQDFVYRKSTKLGLNGTNFNAKIVDYCARIYRLNNQLFIGPSTLYDDDFSNGTCLTDITCSTLLDAHFSNIQNAGFNAIRFNGLAVESGTINTLANQNADQNIYIQVFDIPANYPNTPLPSATTLLQVNSNPQYPNLEADLFTCFNALVNKAGAYGLKTSFFAGLGAGHKSFNKASHNNYGVYLNHLASYFQNNKNILMYNLLLEADQTATNSGEEIDKNYICTEVNYWYDQIRQVDKNHLVSLGVMANPRMIRTFDPGILNVDVLTFHIYPDTWQTYTNYNYDAFYRDLKWVSNIMYNTIKKPWIVGETGMIGVVNPSLFPTPTGYMFDLVVDYPSQKSFGIMSLQNIFSAGASGYGWWQYKDVYAAPDSNGVQYDYGVYFGLVDRGNANLPLGTNKDIIASGNSIFNTTSIVNGCNTSTSPPDYFNHHFNISSYNNFSLEGYVKDVSGNPIADAFIYYASSGNCGYGIKWYETYTSPSGYFLLRSECQITDITILAVGKNVFTVTNPANLATYNLTDVSCTSVYRTQEIQRLAEGKNDLQLNNIEVFPNPFSNKIIIQQNNNDKKNLNITVYNVQGVVVYNFDLKSSEQEIQLDNLKQGIYFLKISDGVTYSMKKIIKE